MLVLTTAQLGLLAPRRTWAEDTEGDAARLYITNAERREAGIKHWITPWLAASGLLELEWFKENFDVRRNDKGEQVHTNGATLQLGLNAIPWDPIKGQLVLEYDTDSKQVVADEAIVAVEVGDWELETGKLYLPFGAYISNFSTEPLMEFGETRATAATLSYGPGEFLDLSLSAYRGRAHKPDTHSGRWDWAAALEAWPADDWTFGVGYLSDLADSDFRLLEDQNDRYEKKVPGVSGYLMWTTPRFQVSLEALGALHAFRELESDRDRPLAWNMEFVHFFRPYLEWALRLEGSRELEDSPEVRYGAAASLRWGKHASLTVEYLRGHFKGDLATNDNDESYHYVNRYGAQISIAF